MDVKVDEAQIRDKNHIKDPRIIHIVDNQVGSKRDISRKGNRMRIPLNAEWNDFNKSIKEFFQEGDGVILDVVDGIDLSQGNSGKDMSIKTNTINKVALENDKHVLSLDKSGQWYLVNPDGSWNSRKKEARHSPTNDEVMDKFKSFESEDKWQEHQSGIWDKIKAMNSLNDGNFKFLPNHKAELTDPRRGLEDEDMDKFWSYRSGQTLNPAVLGDDMVGMPGIDANVREDILMTPSRGENAGKTIKINPIVLRSRVMNGYMIPMSNPKGFTAKHQIGTDASTYNTMLRARHKDGTSIVKSDVEETVYGDKGRRQTEYKFLIDGEKSHLHVDEVSVDRDDNITLKDIKGSFKVTMGDDIKDTLIERGYEIPDTIGSLSVDKKAKYIWPGIGSMTGSTKEVQRAVSPSNAGFVVAREPKESNVNKDYVVVVTEGALKGHIAAKYLGKEGKDGSPSVGDYLANDSGIIVAQVPGVSRAFVESVTPVYDEFNVKGTYIAMDADGRENRLVATGIQDSENILSEHSPTKVMSWNPEQKGLDDALIAFDRGEITHEEFGLRLGNAESLFPISESKNPNPYRLDGSKLHKDDTPGRPQWQVEYEETSKAREDEVREAQKQTELRSKDVIVDDSKGLVSVDSDKNHSVKDKVSNQQDDNGKHNIEQAEKLEAIGKDLADLLPKEDEGLQL